MSVFDQPRDPDEAPKVTLDRIPFEVVFDFTWKFALASIAVAFPILILLWILYALMGR